MQSDDELKQEKRDEFKGGDNISQLKRRMYSRERKGFLPWRRRHKSKQLTQLVKDDWDYNASNESDAARLQPLPVKTKKSPIIKWIFGVSVLFFVVAIIGALLYLFIGTNKVRADAAVDVSIEGASSIGAGGVIELQVLVTNRNDKALELSDLVVEYPDGTVSPVDSKTPMLGERIPLGKIEPRGARRGAIRATVFGNNGDTQEIKVELQYRLKGSSALYSKVATHTLLISSDAMGITIDGDEELTPGQSTPVMVTVKSYASSVLRGAYLEADIPYGLTVLESSPKPITVAGDEASGVSQGGDKQRWDLGTLRPGEERVVYLSVSVAGQVGDSRHLRFNTGSGLDTKLKDKKKAEQYMTTLATREYNVAIRRPFLEVYLESKGTKLDNLIAYSGRDVEVVVKWFNNLQVPVTDAAIKITLDGTALDKAKVVPTQGGFYRSVDSLLLWDAKTTPDKLKSVEPGGKGEFKFKLVPLNKDYLQQIRIPNLTFAVHVTGKRLSESRVPESLVEDSSYMVRVATDVDFNAYGLFRSSQFGAVGPLPPKVEYETKYGIVWKVSNTTSDVEDAVVKADLPHYVRWVGLTSPANEQIIYNKVDHTLEWDLGKVKAGAGTMGRAPRSVTFAVGLVPSLSQLRTVPALVNNQVFTATDTYTEESITVTARKIDTRIEQDAGFENTDAAVVK